MYSLLCLFVSQYNMQSLAVAVLVSGYYYYYYKCQDLSDAITTVAGALYKVYQ